MAHGKGKGSGMLRKTSAPCLIFLPISVSVRSRIVRKPYKDGKLALLFEREWNIEKIREIASGMLRKDRGIVRKKTTTPSGIVRKFAGVQRDRCVSDNRLDVKDLRGFGFSVFHSRVH